MVSHGLISRNLSKRSWPIENVMECMIFQLILIGQLAELDGPAPYLDVAAAVGSMTLTIELELQAIKPKLLLLRHFVPKVETKEKEVTLNPPPSSTAIYSTMA